MPRKRRSVARNHAHAKAAKEKKLLIILACVMPLALFYAYHTMSKLHSAAAPSAPASSSTSAPVIAVSNTSTTPTSAVVLPSVPEGSGQLSTLGRLGRVDPFFDGGPHTNTTASPTQQQPSNGGKSAKNNKNAKKNKQKAQQAQSQAALPPPTSAVIAVNRAPLTVGVGTVFGHAPGFASQELFQVVALGTKTAKIGLVGSKQTFTLKADKPLTLTLSLGPGASWKYTLVLYSQAEAAAFAQSTTTPTTTTPTGG